MKRRDLLKYFGAGTIIGPLGGTAVARLIEVPKIEPVADIVTPISAVTDPRQIKSFSINLQMHDGSVKTINCEDFPAIACYGTPFAGEVMVDVQVRSVNGLSPVSRSRIVEMWGRAKA